jgi:hypothetical protein
VPVVLGKSSPGDSEEACDDGHASVGAVALPTSEPVSQGGEFHGLSMSQRYLIG